MWYLVASLLYAISSHTLWKARVSRASSSRIVMRKKAIYSAACDTVLRGYDQLNSPASF